MSNLQKSRRLFLKNSGLITASAVWTAGLAPRVHAAENNTIKIALVGCGGRGNGAVRQALAADPNTKLWAVADVFEKKAQAAAFQTKLDLGDQVDVPNERTFAGFDAYKKAIDSLDKGDVVLLTTPPAFRPLHLAYAVEKGVNIFAEKPLAIDIPGLRSLQESGKKSQEKGLKVAVGLNNRHYYRTAETVKAIHDGKLGDITSLWCYRMHATHKLSPIGNSTPLEHQLKNIFCFDWTTGGFIVDALIHNLDIACWANGSLPIAAQGQGGRIVRKYKDQMLDLAMVEYIFADGRRMTMQAKTVDNCWPCFRSVVYGTQGCAVVGEGVSHPAIYKDWNEQETIWKAESEQNNSYQTEHDLFFKAIREDRPWYELDRGIDATFVPLLGKYAVDTGQYLKADDVWKSNYECAPDIANMSFGKDAPVMPDKETGHYPLPIPGVTTY